METNEIVRVLSAIGVDSGGIRPHLNGRNVQTRCPLATWTHPGGVDANPSMTVEIRPKGPSRYRCWSSGCRSKGMFKNLVLEVWRKKGKPPEMVELVETVLELEQGDLTEAIAKTLSLFQVEDAAPGPSEDALVHEESEIEEFMKAGPPKYFFKRGFNRKDAKEWEVGFDKHSVRMVFPVRRRDGALIGVQGRALLPRAPRRYYNYWTFPASRFLYGAHLIKEDKIKALITVEGATDAWQVRRATRTSRRYRYYYPVASLGTSFGPEQVKELLSYGVPIYQFPDNNDEGGSFEAADDLAAAVEGRVPVYRLETDEGADPGATRAERIIELLDEAFVV